METKHFATIKDLFQAVKAGEIREEDLVITLDNDCTSFGACSQRDPDNPLDVHVDEANGYYDIEPLYKLLFPEAMVNWC